MSKYKSALIIIFLFGSETFLLLLLQTLLLDFRNKNRHTYLHVGRYKHIQVHMHLRASMYVKIQIYANFMFISTKCLLDKSSKSNLLAHAFICWLAIWSSQEKIQLLHIWLKPQNFLNKNCIFPRTKFNSELIKKKIQTELKIVKGAGTC